MDPLSITAGVIAVLGAADKVTNGLKRLQELRDAGEEVHACYNEISALRAACYQIDYVQHRWRLKADGQKPPEEVRELLDASLTGARSALLKFDDFLQYRILEPAGTAAGSLPHQKVLKYRWLAEKKKVEKLRTELRQARSELFDIVELADINQSMRIEYQVNGLMTKVDCVSRFGADSHSRILSALDNSQAATNELGRNLETQLETFGNTIGKSVESLLQQYQRRSTINQGLCGNLPGVNRSEFVIISSRPSRAQSSSCRTDWCSCICHRPGRISNPSALSYLFGRLHVKFSDIPILTPPCNVDRCRERRRLPYLRVNYFFPTWLLHRILTATLVYSTRDGIDVHRLRAPRIVSTGAPIFTMAQCGDVEGIRSLFTQGRASPYDVDHLGFSALWFALDTPTPSMIDVCKLILAEGGDPHEQVIARAEYLSSFETAWELILGKVIDENTAQTLKSMFNDPDRLNELYFTNLHRRVIGLPVYEDDNKDDITEHDANVFDAMGRTPLHWAVVRNDIKTVRILLNSGADPNMAAERSGWTSMHFAARARNIDPEICQLLLAHNADVDARDCHLQTPLSRAIRHGAEATRILIDAGADVNLQYDDGGWSAAHLAAWIGQTGSMEVLLQAGADLSLLTTWGGSSIAMVQTNGPIEMLEVLDRFRTALGPVFEQCGRGLSRTDLEEHRRENGMQPVTDEWWTLWAGLVDELCVSGFNTAQDFDEEDEDMSDGCNDGMFEDAVENQ